MAEEFSPTKIETIAGGAVPELFEAELARVMSNIDDLNAPAKQKRTLTLEFTFKPDSSRQAVEVNVVAKSKLASPKVVESVVFVVRNGKGEAFAVDNNTKQPDMFRG